MGEYNYSTRQKITEKRKADMYQRIRKFVGKASKMIKETYDGYRIDEDYIFEVIREYQKEPDKKPSEWFASKDHKGLLDVFVPKKYQESFLYITLIRKTY